MYSNAWQSMTNDVLIWFVPAIFTVLGVAYLAGRQTMALSQSKAQIAAVHRRFDEFRDQMVKLSFEVSQLREVLIARGYIEPGTNPGNR
jgi:hypothetical protein